ncbi:MAG TPA: PepSY-associated TM helix domain-containing protein [Longimicrobiales bacterium]
MSRGVRGRPRTSAGPAARPRRRELPVFDALRWIRRIHLLAGVSVGVLLVVAGLTGSALVYRAELDAWLHPELLRVEPGPSRVPLDSIVAVVRAAYPDERPRSLQLARAPNESHEVTFVGEDPLQVYVDPYTGRVLGARRESETLPNLLFEIHTTLLAGETGEKVMGTAALLLLVLVATGIVVWWPGLRGGARRIWEACVVRRCANWRRINFDLHRALGVWSTVFLTVMAVTGASLAFSGTFMAGLNWMTRSPPRPAAPVVEPVPGAAPLPVDTLVRLADAVVPDGIPTYITLPTAAGAPLVVRKKVPAELHPNGRNFIYLHPQTGEVREVEDALQAPAGTRAYNVLYPVHIGRWGGWASKLVYAGLGLSPVILFISGCLMWWSRSGRRLWGRGAERLAAASLLRDPGAPRRRRAAAAPQDATTTGTPPSIPRASAGSR